MQELEKLPAMSERPFSPTDAGDLETINRTNRIFEKWLRNVFSQAASVVEAPRRRVLKTGLVASPGVRYINWQIAVDAGALLKERPIPLE